MPVLATLSLAAWLMLSSTSAAALMFNQQRVEAAGLWASMELALGEERYYRASNLGDFADTSFSVDFVPPRCTPRLELRVGMDKVAARDEALEAAGTLRVDLDRPHASEASLSRERGDDGAYAGFAVHEPFRLLHELNAGKTLRLEIDDGVEPWYLAFGLSGAGVALDRAARLCREASLPTPDADREPASFF